LAIAAPIVIVLGRPAEEEPVESELPPQPARRASRRAREGSASLAEAARIYQQYF
jgi:hypothetical protein